MDKTNPSFTIQIWIKKKTIHSKLSQRVWSKDHNASKLEQKQNNCDAKIPFHQGGNMCVSLTYSSHLNLHFKILSLLLKSHFLLKTPPPKATILTNENVITLLIFHSLTAKESALHPHSNLQPWSP